MLLNTHCNIDCKAISLLLFPKLYSSKIKSSGFEWKSCRTSALCSLPIAYSIMTIGVAHAWADWSPAEIFLWGGGGKAQKSPPAPHHGVKSSEKNHTW